MSKAKQFAELSGYVMQNFGNASFQVNQHGNLEISFSERGSCPGISAYMDPPKVHTVVVAAGDVPELIKWLQETFID